MRRILLSFSALVAFTCSTQANPNARQAVSQAVPAPQRDPQAVAIVQQAVKAMGGAAPTDSTATGTINLVAGSQDENGTITILTKGTAETSEQINLPSGQRAITYSNGQASEATPSGSGSAAMQLAVTDQCPIFPLPQLLGALANPDESFLYIGEETLDGAPVQHVQSSNSFASRPTLTALTPFSLTNIWFDLASGLPVKLAYTRHVAGGAAASFPVEIYFSGYRNVGGFLYPFQIQKSFNGTPWQSITIQSVVFNTGLTDAQFQVQ